MEHILDIENRQQDYDQIFKEAFRTESGLRAIGFIYHDHSTDVKSYENVIRLKENIEYRIFGATHQYLVFLRDLGTSEAHLQELYKKNPHFLDPNTFFPSNPHFDKIENELSAIFDSIIFHLASVFDYLSHSVSYMFFENKQRTSYWTAMSKKARGDFKGKYVFCEVFDKIDRRFVGRLYDYRSRLMHNRRDKHEFGGTVGPENFNFKLKILTSNEALKHFKIIRDEHETFDGITLTYMSSWLLRKTFVEIEELLDAIREDLIKNSNFRSNIRKPKNPKGLNIASFNPDTKGLEPSSEGIWKMYKGKKQQLTKTEM